MLTPEQKQNYILQIRTFAETKTKLIDKMQSCKEDPAQLGELEKQLEDARPKIIGCIDVTCNVCDGYSLSFAASTSLTHTLYECELCGYKTVLSE